jgi:hypothetical protein
MHIYAARFVLASIYDNMEFETTISKSVQPLQLLSI